MVAEKLHIIVVRGVANSRLKDYFDLWTIAKYSELEGGLLVRAIAATFARRETALPENAPVGLGDELLADNRKQNDWRAFLAQEQTFSARARRGCRVSASVPSARDGSSPQ